MNKKGLSTLEAGVLIALVAAGFLAIQGYLKRAVQGNWRINADSFSDEQFEPGVSREIFNSAGESPAIIFQGSNISARKLDPDEELGNYSVASLQQEILRIPNWGVYQSENEENEEE